MKSNAAAGLAGFGVLLATSIALAVYGARLSSLMLAPPSGPASASILEMQQAQCLQSGAATAGSIPLAGCTGKSDHHQSPSGWAWPPRLGPACFEGCGCPK